MEHEIPHPRDNFTMVHPLADQSLLLNPTINTLLQS